MTWRKVEFFGGKAIVLGKNAIAALISIQDHQEKRHLGFDRGCKDIGSEVPWDREKFHAQPTVSLIDKL